MRENKSNFADSEIFISAKTSLDTVLNCLEDLVSEDHPLILNGRVVKALIGIDEALDTIQQYGIEHDDDIGKLYAIVGFLEGMHGVICHYAADLAASEKGGEEK